jgi:hypothetical protein
MMQKIAKTKPKIAANFKLTNHRSIIIQNWPKPIKHIASEWKQQQKSLIDCPIWLREKSDMRNGWFFPLFISHHAKHYYHKTL